MIRATLISIALCGPAIAATTDLIPTTIGGMPAPGLMLLAAMAVMMWKRRA